MKNFTVGIENEAAYIFYKDEKFLDNIYLKFSLLRGLIYTAKAKEVQTGSEGEVTVIFDPSHNLKKLNLIISEKYGTLQFSIDAQCPDFSNYYNNIFAYGNSVSLLFDYAGEHNGVLSNYMKYTWWMAPSFSESFGNSPALTQSVFVNGTHTQTHFLPLVCDGFRCNIEGNSFNISVCRSYSRNISGTFLSLANAASPYDAVKNNFDACRRLGSISVPLKEERTYPEMFEYLGWCSWNAFYQDVTSAKLYSKMEEFKSKNIPVKWVLIDDGWSVTPNSKLCSFTEDKEKFPEGLDNTIDCIKNKYGIKNVGVWHAFTGYWDGIEEDCELYSEQSENLVRANNGAIIPSPETEKAFAFWDAWHSYLHNCGVDFVKVDVQSTYSHHIDGIYPTPKGVRQEHEALERSIEKHFCGAVMNCMGMNMEDILTRPKTALNRSSDDFFPNEPERLASHFTQNTYNSALVGQICFCDFDMWWSGQESALRSAILRAISGGPIYLSDEIGGTELKYITPACDSCGRIYRCDDAARPTVDCFYTDCTQNDVPLKIFNRSGKNFAVAAFNLREDKVSGELMLSDIPGTEGSYLAQDYFTKELFLLTPENSRSFSLEKDGAALWNLYPVIDGEALLGDPDKYMGCATECNIKVDCK